MCVGLVYHCSYNPDARSDVAKLVCQLVVDILFLSCLNSGQEPPFPHGRYAGYQS